MEARGLSDGDQKTWVFPIVGFFIDLCVRFSEKFEICDEKFWNGFFIFYFGGKKNG